jgi:hypothetical protein
MSGEQQNLAKAFEYKYLPDHTAVWFRAIMPKSKSGEREKSKLYSKNNTIL